MTRYGGVVTIPPMVSVFTKGIGWVDEQSSPNTPSSGTWIVANLAFYQPLVLPTSCILRRLWWANGATASGNVDCGVYADTGERKPGTRIISAGSTAQSGTNSVQFVDVTDTSLTPGLYWLALVVDSGTATMFRSTYTSGTYMDAAFGYTQMSAFALPSSATPIEKVYDEIYLFGFSTRASNP